jgi:hypothetical protein
MSYFLVEADDTNFADRWFLDDPLTATGEELDPREFRYGRPYVGPLPANVPIHVEGRKVAFTLGSCDMPVVTQEIAEMVARMSPTDVQMFPVSIASSLAGYSILNVVNREACVDENRSEILWWKPEDGRPDKVGRYRMLSNLKVDPAKTNGRHIFRIKDYAIDLIVSERLKNALEGIPDLGIVFDPV